MLFPRGLLPFPSVAGFRTLSDYSGKGRSRHYCLGVPGRSHFDYCVDWIVDKLDQAAAALPATRPNNDLGRATSTIAKALKARVLLYAASPLWNGSFPYTNWKNEKYETPEYGNELVSHTYDESKWTRALTACQEALAAATEAGYELFDIEAANRKAERDEVPLPFVPGKEEDTPENQLFKERVRMFQYLGPRMKATITKN